MFGGPQACPQHKCTRSGMKGALFWRLNPGLGTVNAVLFHHTDRVLQARQLIPRQYRVPLAHQLGPC